MAKRAEIVEIKQARDPELWISRLGDLLRTVSAMDNDERAAAFALLKSKYRAEWPSESY